MKERESRTCHKCGSDLVLTVGTYEHVENVGGIRVTDTKPNLTTIKCVGCDEVIITLTDLQNYERRAARVALQERSASGAALKYARKALGLRQQDLASLLDTTPETLSRWENDHEKTSRSVQLALVGILYAVDAGQMDLDAAVRDRSRAISPHIVVKCRWDL